MGATKIPYLDKVYNPVLGCSPKMPCAARCWAVPTVVRLLKNPKSRLEVITAAESAVVRIAGPWHWSGRSALVESWLDAPLHWRKPQRVGVCFLGDLFAEAVPIEWIARVFDVMCSAIVTCRKPKCKHEDPECWQGDDHTYYVLTKQAERMKRCIEREIGQWSCDNMAPDSCLNLVLEVGDWPPKNIRLGVSVCDQDDANRQVPILQDTPAAFRWVSIEPMIEDIDLTASGKQGVGEQLIDYLDWVVIGCESSPGRRPMPWSWAERVVEQCKAAGVPCWVKQLDGGDRVLYPGTAGWPTWAKQETVRA